jgi:hypothetical protein
MRSACSSPDRSDGRYAGLIIRREPAYKYAFGMNYKNPCPIFLNGTRIFLYFKLDVISNEYL